MAKFQKQSTSKKVVFDNHYVTSKSLVNTSGRVFEHIPSDCVQSNPTLSAAHSLWINSMCIRAETLDMCYDDESAFVTPLDVQLLLHVMREPAVETTAYSLIINISKTCAKRFEFFPGAQIQIPATSTRRQTAVTIELRKEDSSNSFVMQLNMLSLTS